jgi:hypothetical protein
MTPRLEEEFRLLEERFGYLEQDPDWGWFIIRWPLPSGWNKQEVRVLVLIPPGYPATPPDNFYTDPDLRLANGQIPANASPDQMVANSLRLQFSYHVEPNTWHPHAEITRGHNLLTFLDGVGRRLNEVN